MTLESRQGDLFASDVDALAHGCNCAGAMGRGIAVEFRRRWPEMYEEYKARCGSDRFGLGDVFVWEADGQTIYNLGTQKTWRTKAQLTAIESSVRSMLEHAESAGIRSVGVPRIGAGLGGLAWEDVEECLHRVVDRSPVRVVVHELGN